MLTNDAFRRRQIMRKVYERVQGAGRFVDIGVVLHVVTADPKGQTLLEGKPPVRILRTHRFGGLVDTRLARPRLVGPSRSPQMWYCSVDQEKALLYRDTAAQLVHGSEGAGKSRLLAMWHYVQWLHHLGEGREGLQTAPTLKRLGIVREEMLKAFKPNWGQYVHREDFEGFEMCDGTRIRFVSTHRQSAAQGSPVQGFNSSWAGRDEMQDQVEVHEDIESRGRASKNGRFPQMGTATAKDDSVWMDLHDALVASGVWTRQTLSIFRTPFVDPLFLEAKRRTVSPREFLRRFGDPVTGEVRNLPPELAVYYAWLRARNLVAMPQIAVDVTTAVLHYYKSFTRPGSHFTMLGAHDPGNIYNTTELKRLMMFKTVPTWVVVGEVQTSQTTQREHAIKVREYVQEKFRLELTPTRHDPNPSSKILFFCDPHGHGETQTDYDSVYSAFHKEGLDVFSPAASSHKIKKSARIEMMNRLLGPHDPSCRPTADEGGVPRLVVATDEYGRPVAPKLVEAFESLKKKPGDDNPEGTRRKDHADRTHGPAACSYGLWMFEQEAFTENTLRVAVAEAKRVWR